MKKLTITNCRPKYITCTCILFLNKEIYLTLTRLCYNILRRHIHVPTSLFRRGFLDHISNLLQVTYAFLNCIISFLNISLKCTKAKSILLAGIQITCNNAKRQYIGFWKDVVTRKRRSFLKGFQCLFSTDMYWRLPFYFITNTLICLSSSYHYINQIHIHKYINSLDQNTNNGKCYQFINHTSNSKTF